MFYTVNDGMIEANQQIELYEFANNLLPTDNLDVLDYKIAKNEVQNNSSKAYLISLGTYLIKLLVIDNSEKNGKGNVSLYNPLVGELIYHCEGKKIKLLSEHIF